MQNGNNKYADMVHLPHHVSKTRPQMSMRSRAAQFAPFAALTGYDAVIREITRLSQKEEPAELFFDDWSAEAFEE